jgi:hypothetical protein
MNNLPEWRLALDAIDDIRDDIVASENEEGARELIRWACKIARAEVNTPVRTSETWLWEHFHGIATAEFHAEAWASIDAWADSLEDCVGFLECREEYAAWDRWDMIQDSVRGLGPTKAAMACAMMGDRLGCIDRHMTGDIIGQPMTILVEGKHRENPEVRKAFNRLTRRTRYAETHRLAFGTEDARQAQWQAFWELTGDGSKGNPGIHFQESNHMPFFTILFAVTGAA